MLNTTTLPPELQTQVRDRLARPDLGRWLAQVAQVGHCAHPIRIVGRSESINPLTGEVVSSYSSSVEPDGVTYLRCGNRRRAVCPSCSYQYQGDVYHVIMAGAAGGMKDVPADIVTHPLVFATLTAPSFGLVHAAKKPGRKGSLRCRPRTGAGRQLCPHGRPRWCMRAHGHTDPEVGRPLCVECYDYPGHLIWQWHAPELWRRFTIALGRELAHHLGLSETACRRRVRVQFAKVAEFQRRGLVHFHALIRLDGPPTPTDPYPPAAVVVSAETLAELVIIAAGRVAYDAPPIDAGDVVRGLRFGRQIDARAVHPGAERDDPTRSSALHPETVAAYVAKYATKAAADLPTDVGPDKHLRQLKTIMADLALRATIAGHTGPDGPYKGWSRWADMLGFRGHFASKSRRYSVTLGRLRQARRDHVRRQQHGTSSGPAGLPRSPASWADRDDQDQLDSDTTSWSGRGGSPASGGSPPAMQLWLRPQLPAPATTDHAVRLPPRTGEADRSSAFPIASRHRGVGPVVKGERSESEGHEVPLTTGPETPPSQLGEAEHPTNRGLSHERKS